jgi:hypothetical protein
MTAYEDGKMYADVVIEKLARILNEGNVVFGNEYTRDFYFGVQDKLGNITYESVMKTLDKKD